MRYRVPTLEEDRRRKSESERRESTFRSRELQGDLAKAFWGVLNALIVEYINRIVTIRNINVLSMFYSHYTISRAVRE